MKIKNRHDSVLKMNQDVSRRAANTKLWLTCAVLALSLFSASADTVKVYVSYNGQTVEIQEITDVAVLEQAASAVNQKQFGLFCQVAQARDQVAQKREIEKYINNFMQWVAITERIDWLNAGGDKQKYEQLRAMRLAQEQASTQQLQQQNMMMFQQLTAPQPMPSFSSPSTSTHGRRTTASQGYCSIHQCTFTRGIGMGGGCPKCNTAKYSGGNYYTCPKCHKTCESPFGHPFCK